MFCSEDNIVEVVMFESWNVYPFNLIRVIKLVAASFRLPDFPDFSD